MTDQQLFTLFAPTVPMPADTRERLRGLVMAEVRRLRRRLLVWRVVALIIVFVLFALAASAASAQVILPDPPGCTECWRTWLPVVANNSVEGQGVR